MGLVTTAAVGAVGQALRAEVVVVVVVVVVGPEQVPRLPLWARPQ